MSQLTDPLTERAAAALAQATPSNQFAAKLRIASVTDCKTEEFNVWHANADNVKRSGADVAWGAVAKRTG